MRGPNNELSIICVVELGLVFVVGSLCDRGPSRLKWSNAVLFDLDRVLAMEELSYVHDPQLGAIIYARRASVEGTSVEIEDSAGPWAMRDHDAHMSSPRFRTQVVRRSSPTAIAPAQPTCFLHRTFFVFSDCMHPERLAHLPA